MFRFYFAKRMMPENQPPSNRKLQPAAGRRQLNPNLNPNLNLNLNWNPEREPEHEPRSENEEV